MSIEYLKEEVLKHGSSFIVDDDLKEDTPRMIAFRELEDEGYVTCYDSMFYNLYYSLTEKGKQAVLGK